MRIRVITAFVFVIAACTEAFPCSCALPIGKNMREAAESYMKGVALIFEGKVIKQEINRAQFRPSSRRRWGRTIWVRVPGTPDQGRVVDFAVTRTFRGNHQERVTIRTGLGGGDCGYDFETGQTYLVYAYKLPRRTGWYHTDICSGTTAIEDAGYALRFLTAENPTAEDLLTYQQHLELYNSKIIPERMAKRFMAAHRIGAVHHPVKRRQGLRPLIGCVISTLGLGLYFAGFAVARSKLAMRVTEILSVLAVQYGFFYSLVNIVNIVFQSGDTPTFGYGIYTSVILIAASFLLVRRAHIRATHVAP